MKLYLTGGGDQEYFHELDKKFLDDLPDGASILILPMALEVDEYDGVFERIEDVFQSRKIIRLNLCRSINDLSEEELLSYDALIFEGGNTFKLIKELRGSSFFSYLEHFCQKDKLIYADSAGAIVLGSDIQTAFLGEDGDEDSHKLQDYRGLGILKEWSMHCHYEPAEFEQIQELMFSTGSTVICLPEPSGICFDGDAIEVFGELPVKIITFSGVEKLGHGGIKEL
jgi:peptidase E